VGFSHQDFFLSSNLTQEFFLTQSRKILFDYCLSGRVLKSQESRAYGVFILISNMKHSIIRASSRGKNNGSAKCANTQQSLFDNNVIEHAAANQLALCLNPPTESKRHTMENARRSYPQKWNEYTAAQINEKAKFLELLYSLCSQIEDPPQHMGRPRIPLADRLFSTVFKVYSTVSGRRFMSDLREARQREYISTMPNFSILSRSLESEELTPYLK
jgi:hypothetical protein